MHRLIEYGIRPESGPVLVSGATGGVGLLAVRILALRRAGIFWLRRSKGRVMEGPLPAVGWSLRRRWKTTVFPFILRGISLLGIDSVECPQALRQQLWNRIPWGWKLKNLESRAATCPDWKRGLRQCWPVRLAAGRY